MVNIWTISGIFVICIIVIMKIVYSMNTESKMVWVEEINQLWRAIFLWGIGLFIIGLLTGVIENTFPSINLHRPLILIIQLSLPLIVLYILIKTKILNK